MPSIKKFWSEMTELKIHIYYVDLYLDEVNWYLKVLNSILALASSAAIAGWMLNNNYLTLWSGIIVVSQLITALKPHLFNWEKDVWSMRLASSNLQTAFVAMENDWYAVSNGKLEDEEIHKLWLSHKTHKDRIAKESFTGFSQKEELLKQAEEKAEHYFKRYYSQGEKA
jgi:hypothetical protein